MTEDARAHLEAGRLDEAIAVMNDAVKRAPADTAHRGFLADLLALSGNFERMDKMLDVVQTQDVDTAVGVALLRHVVRGELAREQVFGEARAPELLGEPPEHLKLRLRALAEIRAGEIATAAETLAAAEAARPQLAGECDGAAFDDFRDLDDLTAGCLEIVTPNGKYFWAPVETVEAIVFRPPRRPRDLVWRQCEMRITNGPDGEIFIPARYPLKPEDDAAVRLARMTDFTGGDGAPVRGVGQRTFLVGEEALPVLQIGTITFSGAAG